VTVPLKENEAMMKTTHAVWLMVLAVLFAAVAALPASAQAPAAPKLESLAGVWEGAAQTPNGDLALRAELAFVDGKLGGAIESSMGRILITGASFTDDKLTLSIDFQGGPGSLVGKVQGSRIDGVWEVSGQTGGFWLARPGPAGAAASAVTSAGDPISGEWTGEVMIGGQAMPFSMVLRLSGDTVTGEVTSTAGKVPLSSGGWKDGTLLLAFPYVSGEPVSMGAQLQEGKLAGVIDYNRGEATGTWSASRKQ
jgi:hypothetical protein